jgi:hypothetical protein
MIRACGTLVEYTRFQDWRVSVTLKKKKKNVYQRCNSRSCLNLPVIAANDEPPQVT